MIQFYGAPMPRAGTNSTLMLEAEYRKLNPMGRVPFLVDGDVRLSESCAINFYLAEKYKPELMPGRPEDRARVYMWSFWAMTNLQPEALAVMFAAMAPNEPHPELPKKKATVQKLVDELEGALDGYLVGKQLSVADVIAGSVVNLVSRVNAATLGPKTAAWLEGLRARDAWKRVAANG